MYDYRYYNCRNHLRIGREKCEGFRVRAEVLEKAILEHLADRLFTPERLHADPPGHRRGDRPAPAEDRLTTAGSFRRSWTTSRSACADGTEAFETGDESAALGAERVAELKAKRDELRQTLAKVVPLRAPPPNLYSEASIKKFQESLRTIFLSRDNAADEELPASSSSRRSS